LRIDIVSLTFVLVMFLFNFFSTATVMLYFSLVAPAICYLFFLHVVLYVFLAMMTMMISPDSFITAVYSCNAFTLHVAGSRIRIVFCLLDSEPARAVCFPLNNGRRDY